MHQSVCCTPKEGQQQTDIQNHFQRSLWRRVYESPYQLLATAQTTLGEQSRLALCRKGRWRRRACSVPSGPTPLSSRERSMGRMSVEERIMWLHRRFGMQHSSRVSSCLASLIRVETNAPRTLRRAFLYYPPRAAPRHLLCGQLILAEGQLKLAECQRVWLQRLLRVVDLENA